MRRSPHRSTAQPGQAGQVEQPAQGTHFDRPGVTGRPAEGIGSSVDPALLERLRARVRRGRGLLGPRHRRHTLSAAELDTLSLPIGDDGVVIGVDAESRPAVLGINRPTPYDIVLIGGLWTAQVLALRAAATGARGHAVVRRPGTPVRDDAGHGRGDRAPRDTAADGLSPPGRTRRTRADPAEGPTPLGRG
ncbi:hypothetical protein ACH4TU_33720 [Streptomyces physcomitrii]